MSLGSGATCKNNQEPHFPPKELLEERGDRHTQEVTMREGKQGTRRCGVFKPEWPLATLSPPKLSFGESMIVPTCGPKGTGQRQILGGQMYL